ncbi:exonuclease 3'-5' domain-containing protein 2-like [Varroa destructor]|uniref:3'-5' exonuclease domain-containing protein n=1 Tax=Varroa destructor TaxID=109461 RepID=A0A7M7JMF3_VARDE|nr:exonuclease 3'-5' domain-containing protein 2-like [Varroa destructor]
MDNVLKQKLILGLGACAVAAGAWYLSRQECTCEECSETDTEATVYIVENSADWRGSCEEIIAEIRHSKVIALDCEWVTSKDADGGRRKIALLQLAASTTWVALIRLCKVGLIPEELVDILKDPSIVKVGVAVLEDAEKLHDDYKIQVNGCLDLRYMALATPTVKRKLVEASQGLSLAGMTEVLLEAEMMKDFTIRCSDWECEQLSDEQINYASYDVVCAYGLAEKIARSNDWVTRIIGLLLPSYLWLDSYLLSQYSEFIGIRFHRKQTKLSKKRETPLLTSTKDGKEKTLRSYSARRKPLYENCVLLCPDGEKLCTCDAKKAQWYLDHGLGEEVEGEDGDPLTVMLNFEPAIRTILDGDYYSSPKDNVCVICGAADNLVRKMVVPKEYRKHFPKIMKHHNAHDIVLTCIECHSRFSSSDNTLKEQLAERCNAPLTSLVAKFRENPELKAVRSAGNALLKKPLGLPKDRQEELQNCLKQHFNVEELTEKLIEEASKLETKERNNEYISHGRKVVEHFANQPEGLIQLELLWRQHFIDSTQAHHLPSLWSVNHHHDVLAVKIALYRDADPDGAEVLMKRIGLSKSRVDDVMRKLELTDGVKVGKMSIKKGRLLETLN